MKLPSSLKRLWLLLLNLRSAEWIKVPPGNFPIVILDKIGAKEIQCLLFEFNHLILPVRGESFYVSSKILLQTLINLKRLRNPISAYSLAVIESIKPRLVITFIDNSGVYHAIRPLCRNVNFLAIQNGVRLLERDNRNGQSINHDHFICFGRSHEEAFRRFGARVNHYYPLGSLRDAIYRENIERPDFVLYDICLISQVDSGLASLDPLLWRGICLTSEYLARYVKEFGLSVAIAMRTDERSNVERFTFEYKFFSELFAGTRFTLGENESGRFRSYQLVDASRLSISMYSTLGLESFGRGNRTLFFNPTELDEYSPPISGVWSLQSQNYPDFKGRVSQLLNMESAEYKSNLNCASDQMMSVLRTPVSKSPIRGLIELLVHYCQ